MIVEAVERRSAIQAITINDLIEDHFEDVYRFASRRLSKEDAEDAALETRAIPPYMPYMLLPIGTRRKWLVMRSVQLAEACDRAKDYIGEERLIRQVVDLNEKNNREGFYMSPDLNCRLGAALEKQGEKAAAHEMYAKAQRALATMKFDPGPWIRNQVDAGLKRSG